MELIEFEKLLDRKLEEKFKPIYDRLDSMDKRFDSMDKRFDKLETMIINLAIHIPKDNINSLSE